MARDRLYKPGDKVRLHTQFLRDTGQVTGDGPFKRGVVDEVKPFDGNHRRQLVTVYWSHGEYQKVINTNLEVTP